MIANPYMFVRDFLNGNFDRNTVMFVFVQKGRYYVLLNENLKKKRKKVIQKTIAKRFGVKVANVFVMSIGEYFTKTTLIRTRLGAFRLQYMTRYHNGEVLIYEGFGRLSKPNDSLIFKIIMLGDDTVFQYAIPSMESIPAGVNLFVQEILSTLTSNLENYGYHLSFAHPKVSFFTTWEIEMLPEHFIEYLKKNLGNKYDDIKIVWIEGMPFTISLFGNMGYLFEGFPKEDLEFLENEMKWWGIEDYRIELLGLSNKGLSKFIWYPKLEVKERIDWGL